MPGGGSLFTLHSSSSLLLQERRVFVQTLFWDKNTGLRKEAKRKVEYGTGVLLWDEGMCTNMRSKATELSVTKNFFIIF